MQDLTAERASYRADMIARYAAAGIGFDREDRERMADAAADVHIATLAARLAPAEAARVRHAAAVYAASVRHAETDDLDRMLGTGRAGLPGFIALVQSVTGRAGTRRTYQSAINSERIDSTPTAQDAVDGAAWREAARRRLTPGPFARGRAASLTLTDAPVRLAA